MKTSLSLLLCAAVAFAPASGASTASGAAGVKASGASGASGGRAGGGAFGGTGGAVDEASRRRASEKKEASTRSVIKPSGKNYFETWRLAVTTALVVSLGSLAAGAGIGGGGLFVPIYWLVLGVGAKAAVPLSKATILGGAIGNFMSIAFMRHPKAERPMIDYEAATFMQSGELLGVVFGVILNLLLPRVAIIVFLFLLLSYNTRRTLRKAFATRAKETKALLSSAQEEAIKAPSSGLDLAAMDSQGDDREKGDRLGDDAALAALLTDESVQFPPWAWKLLVPMTAYTCLYGVLKKELFNQCATWGLDQRGGAGRGNAGALFWVWYFTPIPVLVAFMVVTANILKERSRKRRDVAGYEPLAADIVWDDATLRKFPTTAILAGVAAGLLGIGGGMVIGPLFVEIGLEPQVGTSTCAFMILWTAASGVVLYVFAGKLSTSLLIWCVFWGFLSGQLGQRGVNHVLKKTGRPSYVIFLLGGVIGVAVLAIVSGFVAGVATGSEDMGDFDVSAFLCTPKNSH